MKTKTDNINTVRVIYPSRMSLIEIIHNLNTSPRKQEEEYENTSDFLEWFYCCIYRKQGFELFPSLYQVTKDSEYESIESECKFLINMNNTKNMDTETIIKKHENIKQWLINTLNKYNQVQ